MNLDQEKTEAYSEAYNNLKSDAFRTEATSYRRPSMLEALRNEQANLIKMLKQCADKIEVLENDPNFAAKMEAFNNWNG